MVEGVPLNLIFGVRAEISLRKSVFPLCLLASTWSPLAQHFTSPGWIPSPTRTGPATPKSLTPEQPLFPCVPGAWAVAASGGEH